MTSRRYASYLNAFLHYAKYLLARESRHVVGILDFRHIFTIIGTTPSLYIMNEGLTGRLEIGKKYVIVCL